MLVCQYHTYALEGSSAWQPQVVANAAHPHTDLSLEHAAVVEALMWSANFRQVWVQSCQSGCEMKCLLSSVLRILTDNSHHWVEVSDIEALSCYINEEFHHSCTLLFLDNLKKKLLIGKGWPEIWIGCSGKGIIIKWLKRHFKMLSSQAIWWWKPRHILLRSVF